MKTIYEECGFQNINKDIFVKVIDIKKFLKYLMIIILLFSIYNIFIGIKEYIYSRVVYRDIRQNKESINFNDLNSDYIGWISINKYIDYPIMKAKDNRFYLKRGLNKEFLESGSIFMDYRNLGFEDKNIVIYGHNMRDNSMFGSLNKFKELDYLKRNKYIYITTNNNEKIVYEIFGVYITDANDEDYISVKFASNEEFMLHIEEATKRSIYRSDLEIGSTDKILTLSTCSYEVDNGRLVIKAKRITK